MIHLVTGGNVECDEFQRRYTESLLTDPTGEKLPYGLHQHMIHCQDCADWTLRFDEPVLDTTIVGLLARGHDQIMQALLGHAPSGPIDGALPRFDLTQFQPLDDDVS